MSDESTTAAPASLDFERVSTASRVAEVLREQLLSGVFQPGTPMRDIELAKRAGVARSTMREALAELARDGLLQHSLHRGMEVARLEQEDVDDIYEARLVAELAGARALKRSRAPGFGALEAAVSEMRAAAGRGDPRAMVEADMAFHLALVSATGCTRLRQWADGVLLELRLVLSVLDRDQERLEAQAEEHAELLEQLRSQPPARALDAVTRHLAVAREKVAASLDGLAARADVQP